jgi:tetratricopeptide (TPR) repeat protein
VFLVRAVIVALRDVRKQHKVVVWPPVVLAALGVALFLIDRTAVLAAALGLFVLAAAGARGITRDFRRRIVPVALACVVMLSQAIIPQGKANPTQQIASAFRIHSQQTDGFLWVSIGNADLDLVKYLTKRTSVSDPMLAVPTVSPLLVAFAGRTTVLTSGVYTAGMAQRVTDYTTALYGHEDELYAICKDRGIRYVLYTIDLALDTSKYSPRYGAGLRVVSEGSLVYGMHFEPEALRHFNLVYENDNYRVFRVTEDMEPVFLTAHPPVYDKDTLRRYGGDYERFHAAIVDALLTYQLALDAQAQGNDPEAVRRFRYCLGIAPRYTDAWLGAGDSLFRMGDIEAANAAYGRALESSPDNALALYNSALTLVRLGKPIEAQGLLDVLIASSRDRYMVEQARELKAAIERDMASDEEPPEQ